MVAVFFLIPMLLQAQEESIMIGAPDFTPHQNDHNVWLNSSYFYCQTGATDRWFYAPLHLPNGVRIKRVRFFFHDSGTGNVQMAVTRSNKYAGDWDYVVSDVTSSGTPGDSAQTANANWTYNLVQNTGYSYSVRVGFSEAGSAYQFMGARVFYE